MEPEVKMKLGDVVVLKSGSPEMTVEEINNDRVMVVWFDDSRAKLRCESIGIATLEVVPRDEEL